MPGILKNLDGTEEGIKAILSNVPRDIHQVIDRPPVSVLINSGAPIENVEACLAIEIARCANMLTVGGNLRQGQSLEIAKELIATYPNESLEDFCFCLRNGIKGRYSEPGKTFRFDIMVIFEWFRAYLDEKCKVLEDRLMKEKDPDMYRPIMSEPTPEPKPMEFQIVSRVPKWQALVFAPVKDQKLRERLWLKAWQRSIDKGVTKPVPPLTTEDVLKEGQIKPQPKVHLNDLDYIEKRQKRELLLKVASEYYRDNLSFSGFKIYPVEGVEIFAASEDDAKAIYAIATTNH